jgi:uncharacterized protein YutE (UPF0331/DUF86 family)
MTPYDEEVVRRRLQHLVRVVDTLERDLPEPLEDLAQDPDAPELAAAQYRLIVAAQTVADTAAYIVVADGYGAPDNYAAAVRTLGAKGILPADLAERLARATGLRNVLAHFYLDISLEEVLAAIEARDDFRRFISYVSEWIPLDAETHT